MIVQAKVAARPRATGNVAEIVARPDRNVVANVVADPDRQRSAISANAPEQRTAEVLATLGRLRAERTIDLDDAIFATPGHLTYVSFAAKERLSRTALALMVNRSYALTIDVERPHAHCDGALLSFHGYCSGFLLQIKDDHLIYECYCDGSFGTVRSVQAVPAGPSTLRFVFDKTGRMNGVAALYIGVKKVGKAPLPHVLPSHMMLEEYGAERDERSRDGGFPAGKRHFTGAVKRVVIDVEGPPEPGLGLASYEFRRE